MSLYLRKEIIIIQFQPVRNTSKTVRNGMPQGLWTLYYSEKKHTTEIIKLPNNLLISN
jgi:hypothetical protein